MTHRTLGGPWESLHWAVENAQAALLAVVFLSFLFCDLFLRLRAGAVIEISTSSKEAALILLPNGASRANLQRLKKFRDYALKHAQRWYEFVNRDLEHIVESGDLYLVTGTDKSSLWSVVAIENHSEDRKISLKLKASVRSPKFLKLVERSLEARMRSKVLEFQKTKLSSALRELCALRRSTVLPAAL
ncbi:hypothetical protein DFH07DRAFT_767056 [Mycena maculata]|uniref:Uncharacterized protein n=1 Tax=Mycena maculata TaxID=230809 RepID=A0AAD7NUV2_9AGAR|nr:hypothetical protein DFH07DRAFT_767056 [Mycena maculata]